MSIVFMIFEWLLILALIGLIVAVVWLATAALKLKTAVVRDAKRLYEPPVRAVKSLAASGKGVALKESARAKSSIGFAKCAAAAVSETACEVKTIVQTMRFSDLKPTLAIMEQGFNVFKSLRKFVKSAAAQQAASCD